MKKKDEKFFLLRKDLFSRLPYGVYCNFEWNKKGRLIHVLKAYVDDDGYEHWDCYFENGEDFSESVPIENVMPYLRPMSSMTGEERNEFENLFPRYSISEDRSSVYHSCRGDLNLDIIDWLNAHHFDYRGLIEKDLALKAPEGMYK